MATAQPAEKKIESTANQVADVRVDVPYEVMDHATYNIPAICTCCLAQPKINTPWAGAKPINIQRLPNELQRLVAPA